ncbi:MAG: MarC family protein [Pelagimonas sp.]|uniref:MarC family protein n=1 Tax=Pelagimonas sp. TaxID=2073170 RepID=UPI003D6B9290
MDTTFLITAFATLFVVMDPVGLTTVFIALTQDTSAAHRRAVAFRSCIVAGAILTLFTFFGESVLGFIGISMPAFRISGGILLFLTALDMLFERRTKRREDRAEEEEFPDPSVFPMAIPMLAGPGSIATVILLADQSDGMVEFLGVLGIMLLVLAIGLAFFLQAGRVEKVLGRTGIIVTTRLLGMLLAALSVQLVLDGLRDFGIAAI